MLAHEILKVKSAAERAEDRSINLIVLSDIFQELIGEVLEKVYIYEDAFHNNNFPRNSLYNRD
jgi:hypothetical protein